jgi:hypothetical protein
MVISWMVYCRMSKILVPKFTCHSSYRPFFVPQTGMLPPTLRYASHISGSPPNRQFLESHIQQKQILTNNICDILNANLGTFASTKEAKWQF